MEAVERYLTGRDPGRLLNHSLIKQALEATTSLTFRESQLLDDLGDCPGRTRTLEELPELLVGEAFQPDFSLLLRDLKLPGDSGVLFSVRPFHRVDP